MLCCLLGGFHPDDPVSRDKSIHLTIGILSGRLLKTTREDYSNTIVKVEIMGCPVDKCYGITSKICKGNSFNPKWEEKFNFGLIHDPSLAVIRFSVYDQTKSTKLVVQNTLLCQATLPLDYLRQGYRSVRMRNGFGDLESALSVLLIHIQVDSKEFSSMDSGPKLSDMIENFQTLTRKKTGMFKF